MALLTERVLRISTSFIWHSVSCCRSCGSEPYCVRRHDSRAQLVLRDTGHIGAQRIRVGLAGDAPARLRCSGGD